MTCHNWALCLSSCIILAWDVLSVGLTLKPHMKELGVLSVEVIIKNHREREREKAIVSWSMVQRHLVCTNSKCSLVDTVEIRTFSEIIVNTKCELFKLVLICPTGKLRIILDKNIRPGYEFSWVRVVFCTSCPGYQSSWVRVVLDTSCPGYESS